MINDAFLGKFDLIITKSVSRFARNTIDCLSLARQLRLQGVFINFLFERISTQSDDYESQLADKSRDAQEYSRTTSIAVQWGLSERMKAGGIFGSFIYGYGHTDKNSLFIKEDEAEIVRRIFREYIDGKGWHSIAKGLTEDGIPTKKGKAVWSKKVISHILQNEKYMGDMVVGKTWVPDYLTHKKKPNNGEKPKYLFKNRIPAIIDRATFEKAQAIMKARRIGKNDGRYSNRHAFSGKIRCPRCGKPFICSYQKDVRYWRCSERQKNGPKHQLNNVTVGCDFKMFIREEAIQHAVLELFKNLLKDSAGLKSDVLTRASAIVGKIETRANDATEKFQKRISEINDNKARIIELCCKGTISETDLVLMNSKYEQELSEIKQELQRAQEAPGNTGFQQDKLIQGITERVDKILSCNELTDVFFNETVSSITVIDKTHFSVRIKGVFEECSTFSIVNNNGAISVEEIEGDNKFSFVGNFKRLIPKGYCLANSGFQEILAFLNYETQIFKRTYHFDHEKPRQSAITVDVVMSL